MNVLENSRNARSHSSRSTLILEVCALWQPPKYGCRIQEGLEGELQVARRGRAV